MFLVSFTVTTPFGEIVEEPVVSPLYNVKSLEIFWNGLLLTYGEDIVLLLTSDCGKDVPAFLSSISCCLGTFLYF